MMGDILREVDFLRWTLEDVKDRLEALQAAAGKVCEAISSLGEIYYEK